MVGVINGWCGRQSNIWRAPVPSNLELHRKDSAARPATRTSNVTRKKGFDRAPRREMARGRMGGARLRSRRRRSGCPAGDAASWNFRSIRRAAVRSGRRTVCGMDSCGRR